MPKLSCTSKPMSVSAEPSLSRLACNESRSAATHASSVFSAWATAGWNGAPPT